jgi:N,N-dimethylglycine/sarcosine dehydrogenase ferredoxin subunit
MSDINLDFGWVGFLIVHWPGVLLVIALGVGALAVGLRAGRWARGRRASVPWLAGLAAIPRRYLVDVHHVVARDRYAAAMHVPTAGGFLAAIVLILLVHLFDVWVGVTRYLLLAALIVMAAGALMVVLRRVPNRPGRLSGGAWNRLALALIAFVITFAFVTLDHLDVAPGFSFSATVGFLAFCLAIWLLFELVAFAAYGPMRHAVAGSLHLGFHPRQARFSGGAPDAALKPLDLDNDRLGVGTLQDFAWNQLLGFDACVSCGRCEAACPAFAAGQPLTPKKFIQDLVAGMGRNANDVTYAGEPYPGVPLGGRATGPDNLIAGNLVPEATIWSCTTCRACVYECPMMIEHVDAMVDLRRFLVLEQGRVPGHGPEVLEEMRLADNPGGRALSSRLDWASDLGLKLAGGSEGFDWLLWLGDGAFELRHQRSLRALVMLLRRAGVDFAVLGEAERDCGDLSRRLGDEATFQRLAAENIATLDRLGVTRIVTADPHALHCLKNEYPAIGGRYQVLHHTQLLAELVADKRLVPARLEAGSITYHDPCYLGRYNGETEAPRALIDALGLERREMARSGLRSFCCGGGGGAPVTDIPGKARIPDLRMAQARATGAERVAVACPNCMQMLEGVVAPRPDIVDIAELLLEAVGP